MQGVLIADREGLRGEICAQQIAAIVNEKARGPVGRRIERDLNLNAAARAQKVDALIRHKLRAAGENGLSTREVQKRRSQAVDVHLRIALDKTNHARWLLPEGVTRCVDKVAADVVECAAARFHMVANVGRVIIEIAEEASDGADFADALFVEELAKAHPLGMAVDHEGFADFYAGRGAHGQQRFRFSDGEAERFFAEHMLAGLGGADGPGNVKLVGQRVVDGVDVWVGEQLLIGAVGRGNAQRRRGLLRRGQIARGDRADGGVLPALHAGNHFLETDCGGGENSPAN